MQGDSAEDERMIQWALEVTNLTEYRDREVSRLSGGQRQRVWITMALWVIFLQRCPPSLAKPAKIRYDKANEP